jgi:hypothetical protein
VTDPRLRASTNLSKAGMILLDTADTMRVLPKRASQR